MNFTFYNPTKVVFGKDTVKEIGNILKKDDVKKVLLVAGKGSIKRNGTYEKIVSSLNENNIELVETWGVQANPVLSKAREILKVAKENNVNCVLAVGGKCN